MLEKASSGFWFDKTDEMKKSPALVKTSRLNIKPQNSYTGHRKRKREGKSFLFL